MSELVRFKIGEEDRRVQLKARIFELCSRKQNCVCCGNKRRGMLIRHSEPKKKETLICHECIVMISLGMTIDIDAKKDSYFGLFSPKKIIADARRRGKQKAGPKNTEKVPCPHCEKMCAIGAGLSNHIAAKHPDLVSENKDPLHPALEAMNMQKKESDDKTDNKPLFDKSIGKKSEVLDGKKNTEAAVKADSGNNEPSDQDD